QLGPVPGDGVGGGVAVRSAGQVGCDLVEDPVELVAQELRPGVGEAEGASVGGAKLSRPVVDVLEDVVVKRLEMGEVAAAIDGVEIQLDDTAGGEKTFVVLEVVGVCDAEPIRSTPAGSAYGSRWFTRPQGRRMLASSSARA